MPEIAPHEREEISAACLRMRLVEPDEHPPMEALTGGVSSLIVRVDTAHGRICVKRALPRLKVAREWFAPVTRNRAEVAWLKTAAVVAPDFVPRILGDDPAGGAFAMPYLDPDEYPVWKDLLRDGRVEPSTAGDLANRLARVHAATARRQDMAEAFANDETFLAIRLEPYFRGAATVHPELASRLEELVAATAQTKIALVHGDVSPKNVLVGPKGPLLVDAECAWYGDPAFDLAFCSTHLLLKCLWKPAFARGYLACFDEFTATYLSAVNWEHPAALEARACRLLAGILLGRVDGKSPVEYLVEEPPREYVRRFAARLLIAPEHSLTAMRSAWAAVASA